MNISDLPDSALSHIISKLDAKSAVSTTLLSTRWNQLFSQIPNLQLSIHDYYISHHHYNFITFMRNLISTHLQNVTHVTRLSLDLERVYPAAEINAWLSALSRLNMSELWFLCLEKSVAHMSSGIIFNSSSLECLVLSCVKFESNVTNSVYLPNLKTLSLVRVTFFDGDSLERVVSACPVLNSLSIRQCEMGTNVRSLRISSASVKEVNLSMMSFCFDDHKYCLEFDMPALKTLHYKDHVPERYHLKNISSLSEVYIELGSELTGEVEIMWPRYQVIGGFVEACSFVSSLHLSKATVEVLCYLSSPLPTFNNLKELKLKEISSRGWYLLPQFLEVAPNFEVLVFDGGFSDYNGSFSFFESVSSGLEHAPKCLASHLRTIKFEKFKGEEDEVALVEYLLKHAHVLRKIVMVFSCSVATEKMRFTKSQLWALRSYYRKLHVDLEFDDGVFFLSLIMNESEEMDEE